jgi:hypothetical protein
LSEILTMIRRDMLKTSAVALVGTTRLSATDSRLGSLGRKPVHTEADFRAAFEAYLAHYTAFFAPYTWPKSASHEEEKSLEAERGRLCRAWSDSKKRLAKMVLENNGYDPIKNAPGVGSLIVELDDISFVAAGDPDDEGQETCGGTILVVVPRTQAMVDRLGSLPVWPKPPGRHFYDSIDPREYMTPEEWDKEGDEDAA